MDFSGEANSELLKKWYPLDDPGSNSSDWVGGPLTSSLLKDTRHRSTYPKVR